MSDDRLSSWLNVRVERMLELEGRIDEIPDIDETLDWSEAVEEADSAFELVEPVESIIGDGGLEADTNPDDSEGVLVVMT